MRIFPITQLSNTNIYRTTPRKQEYISVPQIHVLSADNVSFGHVAEHAEALKELMRHGMVDFWTGRRVISPDRAERILKKKEFSKSLGAVVRTLAPLKNTLQKVPAEIFEMLEEYAKTRPDAKLDEVFMQWAHLANVELIKKQKPIFAELASMSYSLPIEVKKEFDNLMEITLAQIEKKPILKEFDKKDFRYKLHRISQKIKQRNDSEEVKAIEKLIRMSGSIPENKLKPKFKILTKKKNKNFRKKQIIPQQSFRQVKNYFDRSVLAGDKELQSLFSDVSCQLHKIPTFIPFSRLNFINNLKNILKSVNNKRIVHKMMQKAIQLPTANQEACAFIVKSSRNPSDKIGYDIIGGSIGNIDHIKTRSSGGKDKVSNYVISTNYANSERSNRTIAQQFRIHPESYNGAQIYIDMFADYIKEGLLERFGLDMKYLKNLAEKIMKLSPNEKPLVLDLSKLCE